MGKSLKALRLNLYMIFLFIFQKIKVMTQRHQKNFHLGKKIF